MTKLFSLIVLIYTAFITPAIAGNQFYKCKVDGSIKYQQSPCANDDGVSSGGASSPDTTDQKKRQPRNPKGSASAPSQGRPSSSPDNWERPHSNPSSASAFRCDNRKYCSQMTSCAEANYFLANCPGVKMDGDRDGIPCEEQHCGH